MIDIPNLLKLIAGATKVVSWYAHGQGDQVPEATVRGPFCRWLKVTGPSPGHEKDVADAYADAQYAAEAMNALPELIRQRNVAVEQLKALLKDAPSIECLDELKPDNGKGRNYSLGIVHESVIRGARAALKDMGE